MSLLVIDTAGQTLSVALISNDGTFEETIPHTLQHSTALLPAVEKVLAQSGQTMSQVQAILVSKGPGSYTGLRIGITLAKTLAKFLAIPLYSVSSLALIGANSLDHLTPGQVVGVYLDARRSHVFGAAYRVSDQGLQVLLPETYQDWQTWLTALKEIKEPIHLIGQGQSLDQSLLGQILGQEVIPMNPDLAIVHASLAPKLQDLWQEEDPDILIPTYLKLAEAEENWRQAHPQAKEDAYVELTQGLDS